MSPPHSQTIKAAGLWQRQTSYRVGFWIATSTFLIVMAFNTVPTPLWSIYQRRDGFSTFGVTIAFGAYALGVLFSLFFGGHLGDIVGRRKILLVAIGLDLAAAVMFPAWPELPGLIVARFIAGLGAGMLTATITAHIVELHRKARPLADLTRGQIIASVANLGGFGIGALASGLLASWDPAPIVTPFVVFFLLLAIALIGITFVPETASHRPTRFRYRPQRVSVPRKARARFFLSGGISFAAFAVLGLFTSLTPVFVVGEVSVIPYALTGAVVFTTYAAAALSQIAARPFGLPIQIVFGAVLLIAGIGVLAIAVDLVGGLGLFFVGGIAGGAGAGVLLKASLAVAGSLASPANRGEVFAGIFLMAYLGLAVPVIGIGVLTIWVSLGTALVWFTFFVFTITLLTSVSLIAALRRAPFPT